MLPLPERERDLVRRASSGDAEAFVELATDNQGAVYSLCYRMCAGDREAAQDLAQEAFIRLYRNLDGLDPDRPLWPWLRRITINLCLNARRSQNQIVLPLDDDAGAPRTTGSVAAHASTQRLDQRLVVEHSLGLLSAGDRAVLVLRYLEDLSYAEIAAALDQPESTVESRLFRARKRMAELLDRLDPDSGSKRVRGVEHAKSRD